MVFMEEQYKRYVSERKADILSRIELTKSTMQSKSNILFSEKLNFNAKQYIDIFSAESNRLSSLVSLRAIDELN